MASPPPPGAPGIALGIDVHKRESQIHILAEGGEVHRTRTAHHGPVIAPAVFVRAG
jgi:hypothetical protein